MSTFYPEILAPAGNLESLKAAVNAGADAVYLGVGEFNARAKAENFSAENLAEVVSYAHLMGVKVYLTVNTLIADEEVPDVLAFVAKAYDVKVDAFIVQDMGIVSLLKKNFKGINLHASTQMGVHNANGARILKELGFSRVVLSRETTLEDIKEIASLGIEVEYFVQGALCVAFSGNCLMSANALGKSGNRGLCAQLCRLEYTAEKDGKAVGCSHYLSAADLCFLDKVKLLMDAGVTSFKIEGRLRRPAYVAEAVTAYKAAFDKNFDLAKTRERLSLAFSRGKFNSGEYLGGGVPERIIEHKLYNHSGIPVGKVEGTASFKNIYELTIGSRREIHVGDGLKLFDKSGKEVGSLGVGSLKKLGKNHYLIYTSVTASPGTAVNLILDAEREKELLSYEKTIDVGLNVVASENEPLTISASNSVANATYYGEKLPTAQNAPTSEETIIMQCKKSGGTHFNVRDVTVSLGNVFIPKSLLNAARRGVLDSLEKEIISIASGKINDREAHEISLDYEDDKSGKIFLSQDEVTIVKPEDWRDVNGVKSKISMAKNAVLSLPIICNSKDFDIVKNVVLKLKDEIYGVVANNLWGLTFAESGIHVIGGFGLNIYNRYALHMYRTMGVCEAYISAEKSLKDFEGEDGVFQMPKGDVPVMTLAHCPFRAVFGNDCKSCTYSENFSYATAGRRYLVKRTRVSRCYFELYEK